MADNRYLLLTCVIILLWKSSPSLQHAIPRTISSPQKFEAKAREPRGLMLIQPEVTDSTSEQQFSGICPAPNLMKNSSKSANCSRTNLWNSKYTNTTICDCFDVKTEPRPFTECAEACYKIKSTESTCNKSNTMIIPWSNKRTDL